MAENPPTSEEWRRLYEEAIRLKELAPWEWMTETDIFGVQNPETDALGFVSVMGMLGEHYAVSLYLGSEGLYAFQDLEEAESLFSPESLLEIPQLQVSFEDRDELQEQDRKTIKALGLKFRGQNAWPLFRSYRPGLFPWFLEAEEARFLTYALQQLQDVARRFREDPALLEPASDESYLVRVAHRQDGTLVWEDRSVEVPPPEPAPISIYLDVQTLESLKGMPSSQQVVEMDFFMLPVPIQEDKTRRPFFPYMLLAVDAQGGMILGNEMLQPEPSREAMWGSIPMQVAQQLAPLGRVPKKIAVGSELLFQLLEPLAESLGFQLTQSDDLPRLDAVKELLFQSFIEPEGGSAT